MEDNSIVISINESQVPVIVQEQFELLQKYKNNVDAAIQKAEQAQSSAQIAKDKPAGIFHRTEAIESLQSATSDLAEAQVSSAQAQEVSFQYQQKLGEISKYLLGLGVTNLAMNRSVVRELELKLQGASKEELDELARGEILGVIRQLKAQEDIMKKQSALSETVKEHEQRLIDLAEWEQEQDAEIDRQASKDVEHDELFDRIKKKNQAQDSAIAQQASKDAEHDKLIAEGMAKDHAQDEELKRQAGKDDEHDQRLAEIKRINEEQDILLQLQAEKAEERAALLQKLQTQGKAQDQQIAELLEIKQKQGELLQAAIDINTKQEKKISELEARYRELEIRAFSKNPGIASIIIGIVALILGILHFFI